MTILFAGSTDIGQKRKSNQDSIMMNPNSKLFVVADGMGGHSGGDIASQLTTTILQDFVYDEQKYKDPKQYVYEAIWECNRQINEKAKQIPELKGMGTTIVCAFFHKDRLYIGNVGDSRLYLFFKNQVFQLSRDHSLVNEKVRHGIYDRLTARKDPMKNILVRSVGFESKIDIDIFEYKVKQHDTFLLCSDGLYNKVDDQDLIHLFEDATLNKKITQHSLQNMVDDLIAVSYTHLTLPTTPYV